VKEPFIVVNGQYRDGSALNTPKIYPKEGNKKVNHKIVPISII
jgi:hypothetical protein